MRRLIVVLLIAAMPIGLAGLSVTIDSPGGGFSNERIIELSGTITPADVDRVTLIHNGTAWQTLVHEGRFRQKLLTASGDNLFVVQAEKGSARAQASVTLYADVPKTDFRVFLYWDVVPDEFIDLWVHEPGGEVCKWNNRQTKNGGVLYDLYDGNIGRGPQYYALDSAPAGEYGFSVHYYSKRGREPRRCFVDIVIFEGTDKEQRLRYAFTLTRQNSEFIVKNIMLGATD